MSELEFNPEQFNTGIAHFSEVDGKLNDFASRIEALVQQTRTAAGGAPEGINFLDSVTPSIKALRDGVQGVNDGIKSGQGNLAQMKNLLAGAEEVNAYSVPKTGGPTPPADTGVSERP